MKILLVGLNARFSHVNLAIYNLKACGKLKISEQDEIIVKEYNINQSFESIRGDIYLQNADFICFSTYIWNVGLVENLIQDLERLLGEGRLWLGGPEAEYRREELLRKYQGIKGIMIGEGEASFPQVIEYYQGMKSLEEVEGIAYLQDGEYIQQLQKEFVDLDTLPLSYSLEDIETFENRMIYYEGSRGCPFLCSYCLSARDQRLRFRSLDKIFQDLQWFLDHKVQLVKFVDRTANANSKRMVAILEWILNHDNGMTCFHFEVAADLLTEEELKVMRRLRPGLIQLEIGLQSTNEKTMEHIRRRTNIPKLKANMEQVRSFGNIHQHLDLIVGLPYEDKKSFKKSFNDAFEMKPDQLQVGFLKVLHGAPIYEEREEFGLIASKVAPYTILETRWLNYTEVMALMEIEEMVERYHNSMQFTHSLNFYLRHFTTPYEGFEYLAKCFRKEGHFGRPHQRGFYYTFLREVMKEYQTRALEIFENHLAVDLYLREKLKSRPSFLKDQGMDKELIRKFYQKEVMAKKYLKVKEGDTSLSLSRATHLEVIRQEGKISEICLFDYRQRDPLSHNSKLIRLSLEDVQQYLDN